jgi:hypothetical protein
MGFVILKESLQGTCSQVRELEKCKLDLVGVQEVRWEGGDMKWQTIIHFSV